MTLFPDHFRIVVSGLPFRGVWRDRIHSTEAMPYIKRIRINNLNALQVNAFPQIVALLDRKK